MSYFVFKINTTTSIQSMICDLLVAWNPNFCTKNGIKKSTFPTRRRSSKSVENSLRNSGLKILEKSGTFLFFQKKEDQNRILSQLCGSALNTSKVLALIYYEFGAKLLKMKYTGAGW